MPSKRSRPSGQQKAKAVRKRAKQTDALANVPVLGADTPNLSQSIPTSSAVANGTAAASEHIPIESHPSDQNAPNAPITSNPHGQNVPNASNPTVTCTAVR